MKQKYVLTAVAAVGAVALGTVPMWEGTNSVKQEETRTSIIEDPVNTETEGTGTPTPLPTTAPVTGISHTDSYEDLYARVKEWQNNSSYSNVQPRVEISLYDVVKSTGEVKDTFKFQYGGNYAGRTD